MFYWSVRRKHTAVIRFTIRTLERPASLLPVHAHRSWKPQFRSNNERYTFANHSTPGWTQTARNKAARSLLDRRCSEAASQGQFCILEPAIARISAIGSSGRSNCLTRELKEQQSEQMSRRPEIGVGRQEASAVIPRRRGGANTVLPEGDRKASERAVLPLHAVGRL